MKATNATAQRAPACRPEDIRAMLAARAELVLIDLRSEHEHATGHPLFAASMPFDRLELEIYDRVPNQGVPVVLCDGGQGVAELAYGRLLALGYDDVAVLDGGVPGWSARGYELFGDVNAPSKAFGELVAHDLGAPFISALRLNELIRQGGDVAVVDVRTFEEFAIMSIPTARSAPGVELVARSPCLAPAPTTLVVVNCAGRTRGIVGAQSLRNLGVTNQVAALENGTIGWQLAGLTLRSGASEKVPAPPAQNDDLAAAARRLADRAGARRISVAELAGPSGPGRRSRRRTRYCFDVREEHEYLAGHLPGWRWAPGGQLLQETDYYAPVRGAEVVLVDDDGTRANVAASWLAQMGWDVAVLDDGLAGSPLEVGHPAERRPPLPPVPTVTLGQVLAHVSRPTVSTIEVGPLSAYVKGHLPGSAWAQRADLALGADDLLGPGVRTVVLVSEDPALAALAASTLPPRWASQAVVLEGGKQAWRAAGQKVEPGPGLQLSGPDAYRRPYEGGNVAADAMRAYIDWELGLVEQLKRDGTHGFFVLAAEPSVLPSIKGR